VPPYLRIAADLREKIADGELLPGEQVPSLDALAEAYHVSRTTAHRAVQVLVDEGLLESRPRWGMFVAQRH
jgi:DNA-binding GntR family transcriptional regulator